jgi:hypothetical protein
MVETGGNKAAGNQWVQIRVGGFSNVYGSADNHGLS